MASSSSMVVSASLIVGNSGLTSFNHVVNAKLDAVNYVFWKSQVLPTLCGLNLIDFVEGTSICLFEFVVVEPAVVTPAATPNVFTPPATNAPVIDPTNQVETHNNTSQPTAFAGTATFAVNPNDLLWIRQDHLLLSWLLSTLTEPILAELLTVLHRFKYENLLNKCMLLRLRPDRLT
ncbi:hypothetical protein LIER_40968 [Lithospermum erythrorhizon]|uniref:Retrotransposon Copia-like N-terminal domain-containing protein n=1 Tax=Lithospermum erythrorhizon TaxID=34254 RepID=A0AAV3R3C6_LITER